MKPLKTFTKGAGVYKLLNLVTGMIYIGSTRSVYTRFRTHKNNLRRNNHENPHLQNAWNKYREENFEFEVLEECSEDQCINKEQHYLDTLLSAQDYLNKINNRFKEVGYNIRPIAESNKGCTLTDEQRKRWSIHRTNLNSLKRECPAFGNIGGRKRRVRYISSMTGKTLIFDSLRSVDIIFGWSRGSMKRVMSKKIKTHHKYPHLTFSYADEN